MQLRALTPHRLVAAIAASALALAACGGDDDDAAEPTSPAAVPTAAAAATTPAAPTPATSTADATDAASGTTGGAPVVALASTSLGEVLVDATGLTLYGFTPDTDGVSTCYDDCAAAWPPVLVDAEADLAVGDGLDATMFTTVARDDTDQLQVVFGDWPLYTFAGDRAAGDVNGQGVNDVWYVITSDGNLVMPAGFTADTEPIDDGY